MWLLSSVILFMGCPTPPDKAQTNNAPQNGQNPPPQGGPNGNNPGAQGNVPPQGSPDGGPNVGNNTPPAGEGPTGENKPEGDGNQPPTGEQPPSEGDATNPDAIPTPDGQDGVEAVQIQGEPPPQTGEPTPVSGSLLIRVERIPSKGAKAKYTQEKVQEGDHVTFTGKATCDDCEGALLLRAVRFLGPNDNHSENNLITEKSIEAGEFSISVPEGEDPVALELLVDINGDGLPSASEYFAVIEMAGQLIPDKSRTDLNLDSTKRDFFTPAPIPGTQGPQ
jgi:hypothetical protein